MKKIFKVAFVAALVVAAGYNVYSSRSEAKLSEVMLDNVEALAQSEGVHSNENIWERFYRPEGDGYNCTKTGNETC